MHVTAPEGMLIDRYCVKAGTTKHLIEVSPASASVDIDHPDKDSVSHYQVHIVPKPVTETPTPRACVGVGAWYTEADDLAPEQTKDGLLFAGGSGKAVGIPRSRGRQPPGAEESLTFSNTGGTEQFFFRIVIDASADGGKAYQSLSFPGYSTITKDSVSYQFGESIAATALPLRTLSSSRSDSRPTPVLRLTTRPCSRA